MKRSTPTKRELIWFFLMLNTYHVNLKVLNKFVHKQGILKIDFSILLLDFFLMLNTYHVNLKVLNIFVHKQGILKIDFSILLFRNKKHENIPK